MTLAQRLSDGITLRRRSQALTEDGFPSYVRGWCCMAESKTMQRGYRDVGYLIADRVEEFRPAHFKPQLWRQRIGGLNEHVRRNDKAGILKWFQTNYPVLMHLIPERQHRHFVEGFIERTQEETRLLDEEDPGSSKT